MLQRLFSGALLLACGLTLALVSAGLFVDLTHVAIAPALAADGAAPVTLQPLVAFLMPAIQALVMGAVSIAIALAAAQLQKWTGLQIQADALAKIQNAAQTQAGVLVAGAADNLAKQVIGSDHPDVQRVSAVILANLPAAAALVGATPESVRDLVVGEIGKLQAEATSTPTAK